MFSNNFLEDTDFYQQYRLRAMYETYQNRMYQGEYQTIELDMGYSKYVPEEDKTEAQKTFFNDSRTQEYQVVSDKGIVTPMVYNAGTGKQEFTIQARYIGIDTIKIMKNGFVISELNITNKASAYRWPEIPTVIEPSPVVSNPTTPVVVPIVVEPITVEPIIVKPIVIKPITPTTDKKTPVSTPIINKTVPKTAVKPVVESTQTLIASVVKAPVVPVAIITEPITEKVNKISYGDRLTPRNEKEIYVDQKAFVDSFKTDRELYSEAVARGDFANKNTVQAMEKNIITDVDAQEDVKDFNWSMFWLIVALTAIFFFIIKMVIKRKSMN
jgi:hypothetical protein